tara:strand:+ start:916 stop:1770 length:855 start_codon:yes stop_codon:yes gene_type:complete
MKRPNTKRTTNKKTTTLPEALKKNNLTNNVNRIPRPRGLTITAKTKTVKHIKHQLITEYINNNFTINSKYYTIPQLSTYFSIPLKEIYKRLGEQQNHIGSILDNKDSIIKTQLALASTILNGSLESKGLIAQQTALLLRSQGDTYKPFISGEVGKALKLGIEANDGLIRTLNLISGSQGGPTTNILIQGNEAQQHESLEAFTPNEAIQLLHDQGLQSKSLTEAHHATLYLEHGLEEIATVSAKLMDDGPEPDLSITQIPDTDIEYVKHENRREDEYAIVDSDDM